MQLTSSFILLLGSLLAIAQDASAIPLGREQTGVVTLPLERASMRRDLPARTLHQMHNVRSHRRLARMTGREVPSAEVLFDQLNVRDAHIVGRGPTRVSYPGVKLGNKNPDATPTTSPGADTPATAAAAAGEGFSAVDAEAVKNGTLTPANTPKTANSLGLDIETNDVGYIATVQIGSPPRDFKLLMDSGSADFWVGSEGCTSETGPDCGNHVFLGTQSSASFVDQQQPFNVTYGSGAVEGNIVTDDLVVAGLKLPAHVFGVATLESKEFSSDTTKFDGIMGLAKSTLSQQQTLTPVEALAKAGLIKEAITSFKISRLADQKNDGQVTFGGADTSLFDQKTLVTLDNVNANGFWEAGIDSLTLDGKDLGLQGRTAILDTGTTLLIVPPADAQAIHQAIPGAAEVGQGTFTLPCTTNASLAFTFGGRSFAIDPRDIAFLPVDPNNPAGDCLSGISSGQINGANTLLVGDVFLKNALFSTDVGRNTIQLAKLI
ncbi:acid protease [Russula brevipes]|nr:acid protease [Russula brevipes]